MSRYQCTVHYSYPIPTLGRDRILAVLQPALMNKGIYSRGRFGTWRYEIGNMDHSVMMGVEAVDHVVGGAKKVFLTVLERVQMDANILNHGPKVSLIMPAFKTTHLFGAALDSVLAQSFQDLEIIVVNDGSPDTSDLERVLAPYVERIIYIKQENRGCWGQKQRHPPRSWRVSRLFGY